MKLKLDMDYYESIISQTQYAKSATKGSILNSITCSMKIMHTLSLVECNLFDLEIIEYLDCPLLNNCVEISAIQ